MPEKINFKLPTFDSSFSSTSETLERNVVGENPERNIEVFSSVRNGHTRVIGAKVSFKGKNIFVDRDPAADEDQVLSFVDILVNKALKVDEKNRIIAEDRTIARLGSYFENSADFTAGADLTVTGPLNPKPNPMEDEGSLAKNNWRLQMGDFAEQIFPKGISEDGLIILMPGSSDAEYKMWRSLFKVNLDRLIMIEGDEKKAAFLASKFGKLLDKPKVLTSYFGGSEDDFLEKARPKVEGRELAIVSLDTESTFGLKLYRDLLGLLSKIKIGNELMLSLNLVARSPEKVCADFLIEASKRHKKNYLSEEGSARQALMTYLVDILLTDLSIPGLEAKKVVKGSYKGNNSVTMEYIFARIGNK